MARDGHYRVRFRRRREGVTNYYKRKIMIQSGKPRLVIRKSLKHVQAQIVEAEPIGDRILVSAHSLELKKLGWYPHSNIPTAYLIGLLIGYKAKEKGITEVIPDIGLYRPTKGNLLFAALKGAKDAGLEFNLGEEKVPDEDRISGVHISNFATMLEKENSALYKRQFSLYLSAGINPKELSKLFEQVKAKIEQSFGG